MTAQQQGKVAIVVASGFEQVELEVPRTALKDAGFTTEIVSPDAGLTVRGFHHTEKGDDFPIDVAIGRARPDDYCALLLPGGVVNPDTLRQDKKVLDFVRHFFEMGKPVAAICHGPWTLIDAGAAAGRRMTSWASIRTDLVNAGADWVDEEVVYDRGLVTSRSPKDLPAFVKKMLEIFTLDPQEREDVQRAEQISKIGDLIKDIRVAMLTTREHDGALRSRPMATQTVKFDGTLWFFTPIHSGKTEELEEDQHVNVSYADPRANRYISVTGRGRVFKDRARAEELWTPLMKAWFPKGLDDPELGLLRIEVDRAEYWDAPSAKVVVLAGLAKSLLFGKPYQGEGAQHQTIELDTPRRPEPSESAAASEKDKGAEEKKPARSAAPKQDSAAAGNGHKNGNGNGPARAGEDSDTPVEKKRPKKAPATTAAPARSRRSAAHH